jgi:hypothetical protein
LNPTVRELAILFDKTPIAVLWAFIAVTPVIRALLKLIIAPLG